MVLVEFVIEVLMALPLGFWSSGTGRSRVPGCRITCNFLGNRDQGLPSSQKKTRQSRLWSRLPFRTVDLVQPRGIDVDVN